jgi:transcriptional regulator GlxA family with amidase domain
MKITSKKAVGILLFDQVEVLDFAGPFEVFSVASEVHDFSLFDVFTVAQSKQPIIAVNGLSVNPKYDFSDCPDVNILIIPGGVGTRALLKNQLLLDWVADKHLKSDLTLSICTGSGVLGKLGLLENKPYCTHQSVYGEFEQLIPTGFSQKEKRFVKSDERIYTSGGISAGIDLSFHIVEQLHGKEVANATADYMEYDRITKM